MTLPLTPWIELIDREYLQQFARGSGSTVKFAIAGPEAAAAVRSRIESLARTLRYQFVAVDAAETRLHLIQDFFFAVSRAIDYEALAQQRMETIFAQQGYKWPNPGNPAALADISVANGVAETLMGRHVSQWLTKEVMNDHDLAQDFREAMAFLCLRRMDPAGAGAPGPVLEWLRGELRLLSALRPLPIGAKINRSNGRAMLRSLCHWLQRCKMPGLVVHLDLRWISEPNASPAGIRFTPAAVLDAFEVLRQVIDDTERLEGLILVVAGSPALLDGDNQKRGFAGYPALKDRIAAEVRAARYDNPVAPLVHPDPSDGGADAIRVGGIMPFAAERVAIEALRAGVPNETAIRLLGVGRNEDAWCDGFVEKLRAMAKAVGSPPRFAGEIVIGTFGSGKSHLLGYLSQHAQNQNFIVSQVAISKETPLFKLDLVYAAAVRNAVVPGINDDVMSVVIGRLDGHAQTDEFRALEEWASSKESGLAPVFPALLHVLSRSILGPEDKIAVARFLSGGRIDISRVNTWLTACGARKLFQVRAVKAADLAGQRLRFAPALFRAAGFSGWCVLLDEVELVARYSMLQRAKSYAELTRWLGLDAGLAVPGLIAVATVQEAFTEVVFNRRLDDEKVPGVLESRGFGDLVSPARRGMEAIQAARHVLAPPDAQRLAQSLGVVAGLYERSYGFKPPSTGVGELRASKTMREFIKSWITDWDIQRLYGEKDTIVVDQQAADDDLSENPDFETTVAERPDDVD